MTGIREGRNKMKKVVKKNAPAIDSTELITAMEDLEKENSEFNPYGVRTSNNKNFGGKTYVKFDYVYTKLAKNLDKEVSRQD